MKKNEKDEIGIVDANSPKKPIYGSLKDNSLINSSTNLTLGATLFNQNSAATGNPYSDRNRRVSFGEELRNDGRRTSTVGKPNSANSFNNVG